MQDLYVNYDCDVQCTNLFDAIITTLCQKAISAHPSKRNANLTTGNSLSPTLDRKVSSSDMGVSALAYQGILAVLHSTAKRCKVGESTFSHRQEPLSEGHGINEPLVNLEEEVDKWCDASEDSVVTSTPIASPRGQRGIRPSHSDPLISHTATSHPTERVSSSTCNSPAQDEPLSIEEIMANRMNAAEVLRARRLKKQQLRLVAEKFNEKPLKSDWINYAIELGVLHANESVDEKEKAKRVEAKQVAKFLRHTPGLGKVQIGEYISKGPKEQFPFHAEVLREYVDTFNFAGKSFDRALRIFLGEFSSHLIYVSEYF